MIKKLLVFLLIISSCLVFSGSRVFDFAVKDIPPYIYEDNPGIGLGYELYSKIFETAGIKINFKFYPTQRILLNVETGNNIFGYATKFGGGTDKVYYIPVFNVQRVIIHKKNIGFNYTNINDFQSYSISAVINGDVAAILDKYSIKYDPSVNELAIVRKIMGDRVDIGILNDLILHEYMKKYYPKQINNIVIVEKPFIIADVGIIISKKAPDWEKYAKMLETTLVKMKKDGTYLKIFEKYYGKGKVPSYLLLK